MKIKTQICRDWQVLSEEMWLLCLPTCRFVFPFSFGLGISYYTVGNILIFFFKDFKSTLFHDFTGFQLMRDCFTQTSSPLIEIFIPHLCIGKTFFFLIYNQWNLDSQ